MRLNSRQMREAIKGIAFTKGSPHTPWWSSPNVVGLCFARKLQRGRLGDVVLQVHVRKKRARDKVPTGRLVPDFITHGGKRIWTDVHEVGASRLEVLVSTARPTRPGYDIGHVDAGAGTLGCVVSSRVTGEKLGLSCAHVVALSGEGSVGDRVLCPSRPGATSIGQLGKARFGSLVEIAAPSLDWSASIDNVDAATFRPDSQSDLSSEIALVGATPAGILDDVAIGTRVKKVGAATELTFGEVQAVHWLASLPYPQSDGSVAEIWFGDQIGVTRFTAPGDSGALVLEDASNAAIGLHLGSTDTLSVCSPIGRVLDRLHCDLA